jgi:hypothetical protein
VATPICGWELDDVVLWLQDQEGLFDEIAGVERRDPFSGELTFQNEGAAATLAEAIRTGPVPDAMRTALERLEVKERTVHIAFNPVDEVMLTRRGPGHEAACVLDELPNASS